MTTPIVRPGHGPFEGPTGLPVDDGGLDISRPGLMEIGFMIMSVGQLAGGAQDFRLRGVNARQSSGEHSPGLFCRPLRCTIGAMDQGTHEALRALYRRRFGVDPDR